MRSVTTLIGDLKGSEHPEQVVIVSGHLDSWDLGTGAIDDGAGVAVSMETCLTRFKNSTFVPNEPFA